MKKSIFLLLLVIFLITGCNFPLTKPTVDQSTVATQVAQMLTQTTIPQSTEPVIAATTVVGTTLAFTGTPTITTTSTPTLTATPSDPSKMYGDPFWHNSLDSGSSFGLTNVYNDGYTEFSISSGKMVLKSLALSGWPGWRLTDRKIPNYYMEGIFNTQTCSGTDNYGIVFRAPDYDSGFGYYFGITCDGQYSLTRWSAGGEVFLQSWKNSPEINAGSNKTNKIGVSAKGTKFQLFINGKQIQEISDPTFPAETVIGVFIAGVNTPDFTVELDQIDLWQIP